MIVMWKDVSCDIHTHAHAQISLHDGCFGTNGYRKSEVCSRACFGRGMGMKIAAQDEQFGLTFLAVLNQLGGPNGRPMLSTKAGRSEEASNETATNQMTTNSNNKRFAHTHTHIYIYIYIYTHINTYKYKHQHVNIKQQ